MRNWHWIGENRCCRSNRLHRRASWGNSNVTRVWSCGHCDEQVEEQFVLAYSTCIKRANMAALFRIRHNCLCSITLCHASFHLSRFRSILLLVCDLLFQHRICLFFPLSHLRYIHQEYGNSGSTPGGAGKHNFYFFFPPWPMCFWMWQSIRNSFVKTFWMRSDLLSLMTHGQGGPLLCLLLCWLSCEAIRVISVQPLGWWTGKADGPRQPGYLCMPRSYFKNVDMAGDLCITK